MAGRGRSARLESDIQVARDESNWRRVIELAEQLKTRSPVLEMLSVFLIGEGKLELFLLESPPHEVNLQKARSGLAEAKRYLTQASCKEAGEAGVSLDAFLLLGKLSYACGYYEEALENFEKADLVNLTEKQLPCRSIRIVAESYAIKGFCLEKKPYSKTSKFKMSDLSEKMGKCFETAVDLTFLYLQELDEKSTSNNNSGTGTLTAGGSYSPQPPSPGKVGGGEGWRSLGMVLQQLMVRSQSIIITRDAEQQQQQATRIRLLLSAVESSATQSLRLSLAKQLADLLQRGRINGPNYKSIELPKKKNEGAWKPKRYQHPNPFIPNNEYEEIILLLLISEAMAVRNAVLSQSPEFKEQRLRAFDAACNVYDQLAVCLARWGQLRLFHECLERGAIKFSFEEPHTWQQYALSLLAIGEYVHALRVLEEVHRLLPASASPCLLAAKTCYLNIKDHDLGIMWSKRAVTCKEGLPYAVHSARAHLMLGLGYHLRSLTCTQYKNKTHNSNIAIDSLQKAQMMGPSDYLVQHHLSLMQAHHRRLPEAITSIKQALNLRPDYAASLQLLGLLLTAQKQYQDALNLVTMSLEEWPDCLDLLFLKAHLDHLISGPEAAKATASKMLTKWKLLYEDQTMTSDHTNQSERRSESRSLFHLSETGSNPTMMRGGMIGPMSESSMSSLPRRKSSGLPWDWLVRIWLLLAELCLHAGQRDQALKCIDEAQLLQPLTPDILVARGMACEAEGQFAEAKNYFESATSLEPNHLKGLQHLGKVYHNLGKHSMAEFVLRAAAKLYPAEHDTWFTLGLALEAQGDYAGSADCMAVALDVENSSPLLPFNTVPLTLE